MANTVDALGAFVTEKAFKLFEKYDVLSRKELHSRYDIYVEHYAKQINIEATDEGQGIADIEQAMEEGYSTATPKIVHMGFGAGMGLSNIKRFSDEFHITSEVGKGTHLEMVIRA